MSRQVRKYSNSRYSHSSCSLSDTQPFDGLMRKNGGASLKGSAAAGYLTLLMLSMMNQARDHRSALNPMADDLSVSISHRCSGGIFFLGVLGVGRIVTIVIVIIVTFAPQIDIVEHNAEDFGADRIEILAGAANHIARA